MDGHSVWTKLINRGFSRSNRWDQVWQIDKWSYRLREGSTDLCILNNLNTTQWSSFRTFFPFGCTAPPIHVKYWRLNVNDVEFLLKKNSWLFLDYPEKGEIFSEKNNFSDIWPWVLTDRLSSDLVTHRCPLSLEYSTLRQISHMWHWAIFILIK